MQRRTNEEWNELLKRAAEGDRRATEEIVEGIRDWVFNQSLRMLGTFSDAEDATQEILLKVLEGLPSFRGESAFTTWVFSIASNHLRRCRKHMFARAPLSFEFYGSDIVRKLPGDLPDLTGGVDRHLLAEELKMSCTNVMLQCLDADSRCVFVLGAMFHLDSRIAGEILGMTPEAYSQQLSRTRKRMASFLEEYCGAYGQGRCQCEKRVDYAIQSRRLNPERLDYARAIEVKNAMEEIDGLSGEPAFSRFYATPERTKRRICELLNSKQFAALRESQEEI